MSPILESQEITEKIIIRIGKLDLQQNQGVMCSIKTYWDCFSPDIVTLQIADILF